MTTRPSNAAADLRAERLKAALRANLRRRKSAAQGLKAGAREDQAEPDTTLPLEPDAAIG